MDGIPEPEAKRAPETKAEALPTEVVDALKVVPKLADSPGVAIPEVVARLEQIHERLTKLQFFPYQDDWAWLWHVATMLIGENIELKKKCDDLIHMQIMAQLEAHGFRPNIKYMG